MLKKALTLESSKFKKTKFISAKRPSDYWLLFFKRNVLKKQPRPFRMRYLLFLIPIILLLVVIFQVATGASSVFVPGLIISLFASIFINIFAMTYDKNAYISTNSFNHLSKFIIAIKGDLYNNIIPLRLNFRTIEDKAFAINPSKLGLKNLKGVKYKAYQIERYTAHFKLKDNTQCINSLHQVSVQVATTKRRSSGKVKTKYKYKHKLFYTLVLRLKVNDYDCTSSQEIKTLKNNQDYNITVQTKADLHTIKIKHKSKLSEIDTKLNSKSKMEVSCFTEMLGFLIEKKVLTPKTSKALLS